MKNLKKLLLLLMMTSLFLFSCNKSSGGDHVVDQGEIKSTQEDMDKGTVGIQTSGVKYTLNPEVWGKPFENIHVYNELLEKRDHAGDIYGGVKSSFATTEQANAYAKLLMDQSLGEDKKKEELDKVINEFSKMWAVNVIADDKMPKDDEGLKALTGFDNNEKLASVDGYNFVWSYMNKAEGLTGEDQDIYDKLYEDLENVKKSVKVAKPLSIDGSQEGAAAKFDFDSEDIYGKKIRCKSGFLGIVSDISPANDNMSDALKQNREDIIALAKRIVESKGCSYPNLVPTEEMGSKFLAAVTGYPTTFVLDKEGNIVGSPIIGAQSYEGFKELCEQYIPKEMK